MRIIQQPIFKFEYRNKHFAPPWLANHALWNKYVFTMSRLLLPRPRRVYTDILRSNFSTNREKTGL